MFRMFRKLALDIDESGVGDGNRTHSNHATSATSPHIRASKTHASNDAPVTVPQLFRTRLRPKAKPKRGPRINYSGFTHAKTEKQVPPYWEYPDGRIVYNLRHPQGHLLYRGEIAKMWKRQDERCSIGGEVIPLEMATFEHGAGRNKNRRDDRIDIVDVDGNYINSCACLEHNCKKGSRRNYPLAIRVKAPARKEGNEV